MQITKQQLQTIIDNAPPGVDKVGVIEGLYAKGVTVQGVDSYDANQFISQYKSTQLKQASQEAEEIEAMQQPEDINLGTGFDPSFELEEDDGVIESVAKAIGNVPKSAFMLGKDVTTAVVNPIDTVKTIGKLIKGTGGKLGEKVLEDTEFGQSILSKLNEVRVQNGNDPLPVDENGRLMVDPTEEIEIANQVGAYFTDRYGSWENFKESAVEDPVGVVSDIAGAVSAVGAGVKGAGNVSRVNRISDAGSSIQRAGNVIEPTSLASRGISSVSERVGASLPGRVVSEAAPTPGRFAEGQVVKSLDLTAGDLRNISKKTGNDVTDFVVRNNLLKETPEEIAVAIDDFKTTQYDLVRSEVAKVPELYNPTEVPRIKDALNAVRDVVDDVPGLEEASAEVNRLLNQDTYTLKDIQRTKELLDDNLNIYTRSGDVGSAKTARGLDTVRSDLRSFIEKEVSDFTDGKTNIRQLNNDVSTAKELSDAIVARETRGQTRQWNTVFDGILGFSAYSATGDLLTTALVVGGKKIAETPSFRIALARTLKATPVEDIKRWSKEISENNVSPETRQAMIQIVEEAKNNAPIIEAGSQVVDEATGLPTEQTE